MTDVKADVMVPEAMLPQPAMVVLPAEIDLVNSGAVAAELDAALAGRPDVLIADGTGLEFCDCAGIEALLSAHERAAAAGAELRIVVTAEHVCRILALIGADQILELYSSLPLAQGGGAPPDRQPDLLSPEVAQDLRPGRG